MREDVTPTIATEEELVDTVRSKLIQVDALPGQESTEPPLINKNIGPNSLISMKTFASVAIMNRQAITADAHTERLKSWKS